MATFVVGDIQGCYDEFRALLNRAGFRPGSDSLWLVGDLINRGPNNVDVMRFLMDLDRVVAVLGNHDLHFLAVARGFRKAGGKDTIQDLLDAPDVDDVCDWIRTRPLVHLDPMGDYAMVHAGLPPLWSAEQSRAHAAEVEQVISGADCDGFLAQMYGDEPSRWQDDLDGNDRLRVITNYFTRLRFCKADGTLELLSKETDSPAGYQPWFEFPRPDTRKVLFGHWAALEGKTGKDWAIALDTGCIWGNEMTAMRLEDGRRYSVPAQSRATVRQ